MKKNLTLCLLVLTLINFGALSAQEKLSGTWYFKSPDGELANRVTISTGELLYEKYESYNVATPYWKEDKALAVTFHKYTDESCTFSGREGSKFYAGEIFVENGQNIIYLFQMKEASGSSQEALQKLSSTRLRKELSKAAYSQERLEEIENYSSLDELKKEELIEMMNHVYEYEKDMKGLNDQLVSQIGRNVMNRKLISMNFDPDKPTDGYFMKKFVDDPDIKLLLDKQVYFKMW